MRPRSGWGRPVLAPTPPVTRGDRASRGHCVQFYVDEAYLLDELAQFVGASLEAGDAGVVIATQAHGHGLRNRLQARGVDVDRAARQGRYVSRDAAETLSACLRDGWPDAGRFAGAMGGLIAHAAGERRRVAVFGEMVALLWEDGKLEAAIRLEHLWNDLAETHAFSLRCAYPMSSFRRAGDGPAVEDVCAAHGRVIPAESYTALQDEEERLRSVALLQHKAQALEAEIEGRRAMELALREKDRALIAASAARNAFVSAAAHELKTPVTGLTAFAELLLRDARRKREISPERLSMALEAIERQTGKLDRLVACLLDAAEIDAGTLRIEPAPTDLAALVRRELARQGAGAAHTFAYDGPERLDAVVDGARFGHVVGELLDNAVKFSPDGSRVAVQLGTDGEGGIRLSIADEGAGIPPDQREAVFGRFAQAHGTRHLAGLGLGLYVSRAIVELHGGLVWIESPERGGTRFVVTLPPSPR